jgi:hypothetical protein
MKARPAILAVVCTILLPPVAFSQQSVAGAGLPEEARKAVKVVIHPAAEPRPALKYELLPPLAERIPGNAAVWWNRIPAERTNFFAEFNKPGGLWDQAAKWMEIPLGDPREKELRNQVRGLDHPGMLSDMERAARFESCDWELPIREGNFYAMLLPELQQTRTYGRLLSAKARLQIADGEYDRAVQTLQTGYALARGVAQGPTLIHALVGTAIAGMMTTQVREMAQQPHAPNLYWALSALPRPLVDFRPGFEAESDALFLCFPELRDLNKKQLSSQQWREQLLKLMEPLRWSGGDRLSDEGDLLMITGLSLQGYPRAKQYLVEHGRSAAEVEAMPVAQVILLFSVQVYEELRDEELKWLFLPYAEASKGMERAAQDFRQANIRGREILPIAAMLVPAVQAAKTAEARGEWYLAQLRILEALRLYAAAHGRLPDRLDEISEVPIPVNPFDGKPFTYHRDGNKAELGCAEAGPRNVPWRLEITLAGP